MKSRLLMFRNLIPRLFELWWEMSDDEFDEAAYREYENELYCEDSRFEITIITYEILVKTTVEFWKDHNPWP